jgi:hypothetical protein
MVPDVCLSGTLEASVINIAVVRTSDVGATLTLSDGFMWTDCGYF